jgi:UDP-glucose 4-epimerase
LDRIQELINTDVSFVLGDVNDTDLLERVFEEHPDIVSVIHFAAKKSVSESCEEPFLYFENNIQ